MSEKTSHGGLLAGLSLRDLLHERTLALCSLIGLAAVLAPPRVPLVRRGAPSPCRAAPRPAAAPPAARIRLQPRGGAFAALRDLSACLRPALAPSQASPAARPAPPEPTTSPSAPRFTRANSAQRTRSPTPVRPFPAPPARAAPLRSPVPLRAALPTRGPTRAAGRACSASRERTRPRRAPSP